MLFLLSSKLILLNKLINENIKCQTDKDLKERISFFGVKKLCKILIFLKGWKYGVIQLCFFGSLLKDVKHK